MLGGAAVHFALAASFFSEVRPVGPVGGDFGPDEFAVLESRGIPTDDIEVIEGGQSFFWRGHYEYDLNVAHTEDTRLGVFGDFEPKLSDAAKAADVALPRQHPARPPAPGPGPVLRGALQRPRLDEPLDRDDEGLAAGRDLRGRVRDHQRRRDPPADRRVEPRPRRPGDDVPRARARSSPSRASTAPRSSPKTSFFALPGYPLEDVRDPTGAGDSFAGGFLGYIDSHPGAADDACLRRAMGYGTVLASFNVEEFGTERVARLSREEIEGRFEELVSMTRFDPIPVTSE